MEQFIKFATEIKNQFEQRNKEQDTRFKELMLMRHLGINNRVKLIDGYSNYAVSDIGNVYNVKTKRKLKPSINDDGYYFVCLNNNGEQKMKTIHRLVALAFIPNTHNELNVFHIDGNDKNNNIENLKWVTKAEYSRSRKKRENATSIYFGVNFKKDKKRWRAQIKINGKTKHIGYFANEKDAAKAYDRVAREHNYTTANFNFKE